MILFFRNPGNVYAVQLSNDPATGSIPQLEWLFGNARLYDHQTVAGFFIGPRREMVTPWSTNAVEITQIMGIEGVQRIEEFREAGSVDAAHDPMLERVYNGLDQHLFTIDKTPDSIILIEDIADFNKKEGLALSDDEVNYLRGLSDKLGRKLTDSEVFGFSQVNSEHCRHKIFNGTFIIDGVEKEKSLFRLIRDTAAANPGTIVSAYKDNVAFIMGPRSVQFAPATHDKPDFFETKPIDTVISLKAETHNFPTTVEPFNGAATGSGGEIRDRMAGGKGSFPIAGTAVYMTSYPRSEEGRSWENAVPERKWLYQTPEEILVKASNGASDFGNKFGQPLICGSVLTFEHREEGRTYGYDKVIMLAGGIGYGKKEDSLKGHPAKGDKVLVMGGDNYRIGMGGGAVSSVATGEFHSNIELNAIQRSNPEMQKRVYNAIRALSESDVNPIISVHDHGAGGHLNSLSELVEEQGGTIDITKLPVGDPTLSSKEIIGNESQERMGLVMHAKDSAYLSRIASRERAPMYEVGEITGDMHFKIENPGNGEKPLDLQLEDLFGKPPRTVIKDTTVNSKFGELTYAPEKLLEYLRAVLQLESVACKDWLTNKVDRSVTGKIALQQCAGPLQLPLNNLGVVAMDYQGRKGIATSLGHSPVSGLIDAAAGSRLSIAEALTNIVWAPIEGGIKGLSLSANWMWPCKNPGEDSRLYSAVEAASAFAIELGINIPTGKDSLSMTQKYPDGTAVLSPGTVIITAVGEVSDITSCISPALKPEFTSSLVYLDFSGMPLQTGGSSFAQVVNQLGTSVPDVKDATYFSMAFNAVQQLISRGVVLAGHDISSGGIITTLLEMTFSQPGIGASVSVDGLEAKDLITKLFAENPGVILQVKDVDFTSIFLHELGLKFQVLGKLSPGRELKVINEGIETSFDIDSLRNDWYRTSYLLDRKQSGEVKAGERFANYAKHLRSYIFPDNFTGKFEQYAIDPKRDSFTGIKAAIIREKGSNGDREMAWSLHLAGFDVKDVHMTDLVSGRETLDDINMIVFVGGFSNSDVLGSAKGWAGAFLYNETAKSALDRFYARKDTLSLGVCNGCQLMVELGLLNRDHEEKPKMLHNDTHKYESSFLTIDIQENSTVMLSTLAGSRLGIWVAHGEGKFWFPYEEKKYSLPAKYSYPEFPGNPNGSMFNAACLASPDGRHLAIMPHLERSIYPWQWGHYESSRNKEQVTPWIEAFVNAREWIWDQL
ncbi:MAG: phosphoribosylformylglycinamidine synthase [Bacteroidales bacterium]|nr:phosphoribosylformylglycinamidine synthase [Bacteroidales bacterium]